LKADRINTVSPTYKEEILTRSFGFSLDGILDFRRTHLTGILNGIDSETFDPTKDKFIEKYSVSNVREGKLANKMKVYKQFGLGDEYDVPFVVYIGRYANQKGLWMIKDVLFELANYSNAKFFFLGS